MKVNNFVIQELSKIVICVCQFTFCKRYHIVNKVKVDTAKIIIVIARLVKVRDPVSKMWYKFIRKKIKKITKNPKNKKRKI